MKQKIITLNKKKMIIYTYNKHAWSNREDLCIVRYIYIDKKKMLLKDFHEVYMFPYVCMLIVLFNLKSRYSFEKNISISVSPILLCIDRD